ncbi:snrna-activating protein complex subunit 4-like [Gigaspora margarita]|uniref:Snrna-activating protein complex subunit 4-like n=1 Tax=Gigaspora margarita TaxID=4874 RepID=A0A8H4AYZ8_GIGMA|nr:snrna-activating protein complex subunit 4-like [Gigaspora margarita]
MKHKCCTKAENSVYFEGAVGGMDEDAISKIIKKETALLFTHVYKIKKNGYGHIHFQNSHDASLFNYSMSPNPIKIDDSQGVIRIKKSYKFGKNKEPIEYIPIEDLQL